MAEKNTVARNAPREQKAVRTQEASLRIVNASPEAQREQWIVRNPNIVAAA